FLFRNPHSFVHVNVPQKDGSVVRYAVEWGGAGQLGGQGVTRETLKAGDHVIITGAPGRNPADHRVRMVPHGAAAPSEDRDQPRADVGAPAWRDSGLEEASNE